MWRWLWRIVGSVPWVVSNVAEVATSLCLRSDKKVKPKLDFAESSVGKESACNAGDSPLIPGLERAPGEGLGYPLQYSWTLLVAQLVKNPPAKKKKKESTCNAGDLGSVPGLGKCPEEGKGYPHQYSGLENSMDWIVHGVAKSPIQLNDFHFHLNSNTESFSEYL